MEQEDEVALEGMDVFTTTNLKNLGNSKVK